MKRNLLLIGLLAAVTGVPMARGQSIWPSTLNATGGYAYISGNEYEWSVGEIALVSTYTTSSIIVTQGLLQTNLGTPVNGNAVISPSFGNQLQVFPNPASSILNVQFNSTNEGALELKLMDMAGRVIQTQKSDVKQGLNAHKLDINTLSAATYMLQVIYKSTDAKEEFMSYKIQKLQ